MQIGRLGKIWVESLEKRGYEKRCESLKEYKKLRNKLPQAWRLIFKNTGLKKGELFELGCGGGNHLIRLALHGYKVTGLDCSMEVLQRCRNFADSVEEFHSEKLDMNLIQDDFVFYSSDIKYDMVFSFGVVEHFLKDSERMRVLTKCYNATKRGSWCVTVVPNGACVKRQRIKQKGLGGYNIPEIDYTRKKLRDDLKSAGFTETEVIGKQGYF